MTSFFTLMSTEYWSASLKKKFMILRQAVPVLHDLVVLYKMADCCRPEAVSDVISDQKTEGIEFNIVTKFHDPTSNVL